MSEVDRYFGPPPPADEVIRGEVAAGTYYAQTQPDFGQGHITAADQLTAGLVVEVICNRTSGPDIERVTVIGAGLGFGALEGFVEDPTRWTFDKGNGEVGSHSLIDDGVIAAGPNMWQQNRYIRVATALVDGETES